MTYQGDEGAFNKERTGTGTKEWSDASVNIGFGCSHGCKYCYAMSMMLQYRRIKNREDWTTEKVNLKKSQKGYHLRKGVIMFPTTHDITPYYLPYAIESLKKMLAPGNTVLIVSKPHIDCIKSLCDELEIYKNQIVFRFTIGTLDASVSKLWEPGAPDPAERIESLKHAYAAGFVTSVSMEPMLGGVDDALKTFKAVLPYTSDTVWIGKMNKARQRVGMDVPKYAKAVNRIEEQQRDSEILRLVSILEGNQKVEWKDTIKKVIRNNTLAGSGKSRIVATKTEETISSQAMMDSLWEVIKKSPLIRGLKARLVDEKRMTLRQAMMEATLYGLYGFDQNVLVTFPLPKHYIMDWLSSYPVKFTKEQANKEFEKLLTAGFILKIKHRKHLFYPSYDPSSLKKLGIVDPKLAKHLKSAEKKLEALSFDWRTYGCHLTGGIWNLGPLKEKLERFKKEEDNDVNTSTARSASER